METNPRSRTPTHQFYEVNNVTNKMTIGYEIFGHSRPHSTAYHQFEWGGDATVTVPINCSWNKLCQKIKWDLDPKNQAHLCIEIYKAPYQLENSKLVHQESRNDGFWHNNNLPGEESPLSAIIEHGYHLRVYKPWDGRYDIGTFVPVSNDNENTNQASLIYTESFLSEDLLQLIDTFQQTRPLTNKFQFLEDPKIISGDIADALRNHVDKVYNEKKVVEDEETLGDLQLNLTREELISFIGKESMMELDGLFGQRCEDIVLRRSAKKDHCIDFHVDYSLKTMQISLVDEEEYEGGRLVFVTEGGKLEIPSRKKGSMTIHDDGVIHGVTALKSGVRYGLLLLDRPHLRNI